MFAIIYIDCGLHFTSPGCILHYSDFVKVSNSMFVKPHSTLWIKLNISLVVHMSTQLNCITLIP